MNIVSSSGPECLLHSTFFPALFRVHVRFHIKTMRRESGVCGAGIEYQHTWKACLVGGYNRKRASVIEVEHNLILERVYTEDWTGARYASTRQCSKPVGNRPVTNIPLLRGLKQDGGTGSSDCSSTATAQLRMLSGYPGTRTTRAPGYVCLKKRVPGHGYQ